MFFRAYWYRGPCIRPRSQTCLPFSFLFLFFFFRKKRSFNSTLERIKSVGRGREVVSLPSFSCLELNDFTSGKRRFYFVVYFAERGGVGGLEFIMRESFSWMGDFHERLIWEFKTEWKVDLRNSVVCTEDDVGCKNFEGARCLFYKIRNNFLAWFLFIIILLIDTEFL